MNHDCETACKDNRIMLVDNDPANIKQLEQMLEMNGQNNICSITDTRQFFEAFFEFKPHLILLDLKMPHLDGFKILEKLKEIDGSGCLPVIVIAAQNEQENKVKALRMGAQDLIGKPFDQAEVVTRIQNFLCLRSMQNKIQCYNQWLEHQLKEKISEINTLEMELIERLLCAAEFRDFNTGSHIDRVGRYAQILSKAMGMQDDMVKKMSLACKMHDIGKIGIPDEILLKPAKLTENEWETMKTHAQTGADILKNSTSEILILAEEIARTHHEKWDGSGYPNGLAGNEIPLAGRIMALIDVFDALISNRPYKKAWDLDHTVFLLRMESGCHFDPDVVQAFMEHLEEFKKIYRMYQ